MKYAISSCLCGVNCKYSGGNNLNNDLKLLYDKGEAILICPELLAGLSVPRDPFEIVDGKAITCKGLDITDKMNNGANKALNMLKENNVEIVILKESSPSCGVNMIYDGTFSKRKISGMGIAARLFRDNGFTVISSEEYEKK